MAFLSLLHICVFAREAEPTGRTRLSPVWLEIAPSITPSIAGSPKEQKKFESSVFLARTALVQDPISEIRGLTSMHVKRTREISSYVASALRHAVMQECCDKQTKNKTQTNK